MDDLKKLADAAHGGDESSLETLVMELPGDVLNGQDPAEFARRVSEDEAYCAEVQGKLKGEPEPAPEAAPESDGLADLGLELDDEERTVAAKVVKQLRAKGLLKGEE